MSGVARESAPVVVSRPPEEALQVAPVGPPGGRSDGIALGGPQVLVGGQGEGVVRGGSEGGQHGAIMPAEPGVV